MTPKNHTGGPVRVQGQDDGCCGIFFLKNVLYIFNFILLLSGLGLLGVGLFTFYLTHAYIGLLGGHFDVFVLATYILIGTGGFIVFVVFVLGCCATCRRKRGCLMAYAVLLMLVFLAEVGAGILAYMYEVELRGELDHKYKSSMSRYGEDEMTKRSIDSLQIHYRCCGMKSYDDWFAVPWSKDGASTNMTVPESCCISPMPGCGVKTGPSNINTDGCFPNFEVLLQENLIVMGGVGLGLCCLQIFGIVFACCFAKKVPRWKVRENTYWQ